MYYSREQQKRFLDLELQAISDEYIKKLNTQSIILLDKNEIYVTQYVKIDSAVYGTAKGSGEGTGQIILKFKRDKGIPRKNEYFTAVLLEGGYGLPRNWGNLTWKELRKHQVEFSELHCVWHGKTDERGFLLCGFSGISIEMADKLVNDDLQGCVIVLGPQEPPIDYYQNLIAMVMNTTSESPAAKILDFNGETHPWSPEPMDSSQGKDILNLWGSNDEIIIQGPPGTGKTFMTAEIISKLLNDNKSVLVTALTNRALIELAEKKGLKEHLDKGNVMKTNVSTDEISSCPDLIKLSGKEITSIPGKVTLSTFYITSGWAKDSVQGVPFDYVIMDEASQAVYAMIAACKRLGKKNLWIGDQNQLPPIISIKEDILNRNDFSKLAYGFNTLCDYFSYPSCILTKTYRLLPPAAALTSIFYSESIVSGADFQFEWTTMKYLNEEGGTGLVLTEMPLGEKSNLQNCEFTIDIVKDILEKSPDVKIAVLSKFRDTIRMLQNCFISRFGNKNNVLIDTVERIQGMTCDICIYFIPNTLLNMSLNRELFNVATSRAKQFTLIVADKSIKKAMCNKDVASYIDVISLNAKNNSIENASSNSQTSTEDGIIKIGSIAVKTVGKIDLSKFDPPKKEIKAGKKNIYIIDTNVFVTCPDIIDKIEKQYPVVLSAKVIDELDYLKVSLKTAEGKKSAENALRYINRNIDSKDRIIKLEVSDTSLLPEDFNKKSPDNMILSVALKYKGDNPILLTSDNGLQAKAKVLGISTVSLRNILSRTKNRFK